MFYYLKLFFDKDYKRIIPHCYSPYGYIDILNNIFKYSSIFDISFENELSLYNIETKEVIIYDNSNSDLNLLFSTSQQFLNNIKQMLLTF